ERGTRLLYTKTRFDESAPPYRVEALEMAFPSRAVPLLTAVADKGLFSGEFMEEKPLPIGDVSKITFAIGNGAWRLEKTFYEKVPEILEPIRVQVEALMQQCERDGRPVNSPTGPRPGK